MIVGWRAFAVRTETPRKSKPFDAKEGDLCKAIRASQHRNQAQKQYLIERVGHLTGLARVGKRLEIPQKNNSLVESRACPRRAADAPQTESRGTS